MSAVSIWDNERLQIYGVGERTGQLLAEVSASEVLKLLRANPKSATYLRQESFAEAHKGDV